MKKELSLVQWYRQMAVLLGCGVSMTKALEVCQSQTSDPTLRTASHKILQELRVGQRLSQAMTLAGPPFEPLHCGAVEVGEMQGDIALVFERLSELCEESARVKRRLLSALAYPALVLSVSLLGLYLLVRFLAPVLSDVGTQLNQEPTFISRFMLFLGAIFERELLTIALLLAFLGTLRWTFRLLWSRKRTQIEGGLFRVPLLGRILRLGVLIRICQTMETMVTGGLPLTKGLELTARTCGSCWYAEQVLQPAIDRIRSGESVCASLRGSPGLPASFFGLLIAGEESGRLDQSFGYLSHLYEMELVNAVESFLAALEPLCIALVGAVVLGVLLSVFAPLSKLLSAV